MHLAVRTGHFPCQSASHQQLEVSTNMQMLIYWRQQKTPQSTLTGHTTKINKFNYFKYWSYILLTFYAFGNAEMELFRQLLEK